jgi:DNA-binding NarL/FixJ family response regulator
MISIEEYARLQASEKKFREMNTELLKILQEQSRELAIANEQKINTVINFAYANQSTFELNCREYKISVREKEIIKLIAKAYTIKEIAETLCISPATVKTHVQNIFEKVTARSQIDLLNKLGVTVLAEAECLSPLY